MTEPEVLEMIKMGLPAEAANNADPQSKALLKAAITIVGRMDGADWNKRHVTFNLVAGTASYTLNVDILSSEPVIEGFEKMFFTDRESLPVSILTKDEFDTYARGLTGSGRPAIGTVYETTNGRVFEVCRTPDSSYQVKGTAKIRVDKFNQVPENYHDLLVTTAFKLIAASKNLTAAAMMAEEGKNDARSTLTEWSGTSFQVDRPLDSGRGATTRSDSGNLRP